MGLAVALNAIGRGLAPVVLEPRPGAIDKACGEGIMPSGLHTLHDLGVDPPGRDFRGIRYVSRTRVAEADFAAGPGRGIRRTTLHAALRAAVDAAGVPVLALSASALDQTDGDVRVRTTGSGRRPGPTFSARWVVAADGLHSPTRRALGLDRHSGPHASSSAARSSRRFGLRQHFGMAPWSDHVEVHWGPTAEAYVTPVAEDVVGVAVLSGERIAMADSLAQFPRLRDRLEDSTVVTSVLGAGPLRQRSARRVAGRVLLAGDASGYVDALTGEGISLGLAHARAAVAAIAEDDPASYERSWRAANRRYAVLTHTLLELTRPHWARRLVVPAAAALPGIFRIAVNELAGTTR